MSFAIGPAAAAVAGLFIAHNLIDLHMPRRFSLSLDSLHVTHKSCKSSSIHYTHDIIAK